eukprot:c15932_g1_i1 orf=44-985(+)
MAAHLSCFCLGNISLSLGSHIPSKEALSSSPSSSSSTNLTLECYTDNKNSNSKGSRRRVSIFWDLDNKPPNSSPYHAALHLRQVAAQFGDVADKVACANRHAFLHIPRWVQEERGNPNPSLKRTPFPSTSSLCICLFCDVTCASPTELKKHCRLFHRREWKNLGFKVYQNGGYGLHLDLFKAGFCVRTVDQSPQAADRALKRQIKHSMDNGVQCICLVSDDSDFAEILKTARSKCVLTVVIGNTASLRQFADVWFPWGDVANGNDVTGICVRDWRNRIVSVENENKEMEITMTNLHPQFSEMHDASVSMSVEE